MIFHPPKRRTQTITLGGTQRIWRKGTYLKGKQSCYRVTLRSPSKQSLREKGLSDILARCSDEKKDEYYHDLERPESQEFRSETRSFGFQFQRLFRQLYILKKMLWVCVVLGLGRSWYCDQAFASGVGEGSAWGR